MKLFSRQPAVPSKIVLRSIPEKNSFKKLIPREYRARRFRKQPTTKLGRMRRWGSLGLVALIAGMALMISGGVGATATPSASAGLFDWVCDYTKIGSTPTVDAWPGDVGLIGGGITNATSVVGDAATLNGGKIANILNSYSEPYNKGLVITNGVAKGKITRPITAFEYFGTAGQTWNTEHYQELGAACLAAIPAAGNTVAGILFSIDQMMAEVGLTIFGWAMSVDAFGPFLNTVNRVFVGQPGSHGGLVNALFLNYLAPIVMFGALWMGWQGLVKKRSSQAIQGAIWMISAASLALAFLLHPIGVAGTLNHGVSYIATEIISLEANAGTAALGTPSTVSSSETPNANIVNNPITASDMCALPDGTYPGSSDKGWRMAQCSIWQTFVYSPWASGQFGATVGQDVKGQTMTIPNGASTSSSFSTHAIQLVYLNAHVYNHDQTVTGPSNWMGQGVPADKVAANTAVINTLINLQGAKSATNPTPSTPSFTGDNWTGRISISFIDFVAMLASFIPIMTLTFSLITLQLGLIFLLLLAPIFLTFGIHPGFGRRLTMGWLEMIVANTLKRIGTAGLLGTLLLMVQVIMSIGGAWIIQTMLIVFSCIGFMAYRGKILKMFRINLGGSSMGDSQEMKQVGKNFFREVKTVTKEGLAAEGGFTKGAASGLLGRNRHTRQFVTAGKDLKKIYTSKTDPLAPVEKRIGDDNKNRSRQMAEDSTMENTKLNEMDQWAKQYNKTKQAVPRPSDPEKARWLEEANIPMRDRVINSGNSNRTSEGAGNGSGEGTGSQNSSGSTSPATIDASHESMRELEHQELLDEFDNLTYELKNLNDILRAVAQKRLNNGGVLPDGSVGDLMEENVRVESERINNRLHTISDALDNWDNRPESPSSEDNPHQDAPSRPYLVTDVPEVPLSERYSIEVPIQGAPVRPQINLVDAVDLEIPEVPFQAKRPQNPFPKSE